MEEKRNPNLPPMWNDKASSSSAPKKDVIKERNRREKMNEFYDELQSMVPNLFPKATKSRIVEETMSYIKTLEEVILALEDTVKKPTLEVCNASDVPFHGPGSSFVSVDVSANMAFFGIISPSRTGLVTKVVEVFEKHKADVLASTVTCDGGIVSMTVTAVSLSGQADVAKIKADLMTI